MATEDLAADPVGPLADEFMERRRRGEQPTVSEYAARHPELADRIRQVFSMIVLMEKAGSQDGEDSSGDGPRPADSQTTPERIGGYRILREIGQGGMGVVYEAEQTALGRHVALKVLPLGAARKRDRLERFQREARAAARLHHTNIVPVYEVGAAGDLCYYAMQFIHGQPLDLVLEELRALYAEGRSPATDPQPADDVAGRKAVAWSLVGQVPTQTQVGPPDRNADLTLRPAPAAAGVPPPSASSLALTGSTIASAGRSGRGSYYRNVASIGVQVAEALDYAHREGVIHRDIKPSNLLLDTAGRVWVTDFGLAYQPDPDARGGASLTQTGEIVGTIRYMPPERFRGWSDPRSDVYSLGLTLYEMLLFRPAFEAPEQVALMQKAIHEEPTRLRKADPQIPRDLETVILKAIDKEPGRRYQSAADLAGDLKRFLEDRPVLARHTGIAERAWRWSRRHPSRAALAVSVAVTFLLILAGGLWQAHQRQLRAERVGQGLDWAGQLRDQGRWGEARAAAEPLLPAAAGDAGMRQRVEDFLDDVRLVERVLEIRSGKGDHLDDVATDADYTQAFREHGLDIESFPADELAERIRARPEPVGRELVVAIDDWAWERRRHQPDGPGWHRLVAVAQTADPDPWRQRLRVALGGQGAAVATALRNLRAEAKPLTMPVQSLQLMGEALAATGNVEAAVSWLREAQRRHPGDVWINYRLAKVLHGLKPPRLDEAIGFYRAAVALRAELAHELAHALEQKGDPKEAIALFEELIRLRPHNAGHHNCLGRAFEAQGNPTAALAEYDKALDLRPRTAEAHNNRGNALAALSKRPEALAAYNEAIDCRPGYAEAHHNKGLLLEDMDRPDEAVAAYTEAIRHKPGWAMAYLDRSNALAEMDDLHGALADLDQAILHERTYATAHYNRGKRLYQLGRLDEALGAFEEAIKQKANYAKAHLERGRVLMSLGRFPESLDALQQGHELSRKDPNWSVRSGDRVRVAERLIELEKQLPALLRGDFQPRDAGERAWFARCCAFKGHHASAARLFEETFNARPELMDNLSTEYRYHAACSAAMAGCGRGRDADQLDELARARSRKQAVAWLRADLAGWSRRFRSNSPNAATEVRETLRGWRWDVHLAGIRECAEIAKLPAAERDSCKELWADVADLLKRTDRRK